MRASARNAFVLQGSLLLLIILGLNSIGIFQVLLPQPTTALVPKWESWFPLVNLGIISFLITIWLIFEKILRRSENPPFRMRLKVLILFLIYLGILAISSAATLHRDHGLIASNTEQLTVESVIVFGMMVSFIGILLGFIGLSRVWFVAIPYWLLITGFWVFTLGIFGQEFYGSLLKNGWHVAVFGGIFWGIKKLLDSESVLVRYFWIGCILAVIFGSFASVTIAKTQIAKNSVDSAAEISQGCTAEQFTHPPTDQYIPGFIRVNGSVKEYEDKQVLSLIKKAGVTNSSIGKRRQSLSGSILVTTDLLIEVPSEQTLTSACILHNRDTKSALFDPELLSREQFCNYFAREYPNECIK
jgi:hypothetical protein